MVTERVNHSPNPPAPLIRDRPDLPGTRGDRAGEDPVGVVNRQDHTDSAAVSGFRTEIVVTGGFISEPELRAFN